MHVIDGPLARRNIVTNKYGSWNRGADSSMRSGHPADASSRIFDGLANVRPRYSGQKLKPTDPVFAMGFIPRPPAPSDRAAPPPPRHAPP